MKTNLPLWSKPIPISTDSSYLYINDQRLKTCMKEIGYKFENPLYLVEALWHRSLKNNDDFNYERLEFLGDSILQFYTCLKLFHKFSHYKEGELTKALGNIVSAKALYTIAKKLNIDSYIFVSEPLKNQISDSILTDVYESIIAAIFADGGIDEAFNFLDRTLTDLFDEPLNNSINYKSILQEWVQKNKMEMPQYEIIEQEGPEHELIFKIMIKVTNLYLGPVLAKSKKIGEQKAAKLAVENLGLLNE